MQFMVRSGSNLARMTMRVMLEASSEIPNGLSCIVVERCCWPLRRGGKESLEHRECVRVEVEEHRFGKLECAAQVTRDPKQGNLTPHSIAREQKGATLLEGSA